MSGFRPGIHDFGAARKQLVDARAKPGHDEFSWVAIEFITLNHYG